MTLCDPVNQTTAAFGHTNDVSARNNGTIERCKTKASNKVNCGFRQHADGNSQYRVQGFYKVREMT